MKEAHIPKMFYKIPYKGLYHPQHDTLVDLKNGANCQLFIYSILEYFGYPKLTFRSSELWEDKKMTVEVNNLDTYDIILFNKTNQSYGAHLGLYIGENKIIHLSKEIGFPIVWTFTNFKNDPNYSKIVGIKRVLKYAK